jgi:hypothetical protein
VPAFGCPAQGAQATPSEAASGGCRQGLAASLRRSYVLRPVDGQLTYLRRGGNVRKDEADAMQEADIQLHAVSIHFSSAGRPFLGQLFSACPFMRGHPAAVCLSGACASERVFPVAKRRSVGEDRQTPARPTPGSRHHLQLRLLWNEKDRWADGSGSWVNTVQQPSPSGGFRAFGCRHTTRCALRLIPVT